MNLIENDVFTVVANKLRTELGAENIYVTGEYTPTPPKFPCVFLYEADNFNAGFDGCNHEVVTGVMYEVEVFSNLKNGKKAEAIKSFTIAGNFFELLKSIHALSNEVEMGVPTGFTTFGSPAVLIKDMSVAGK